MQYVERAAAAAAAELGLELCAPEPAELLHVADEPIAAAVAAAVERAVAAVAGDVGAKRVHGLQDFLE